MKIENNTITADEGKMLINDMGCFYSVTLGDWDSAENYKEITVEEYRKKLEEVRE